MKGEEMEEGKQDSISRHIFFSMHLVSSKWSPKRTVAYIHMGEPSELGLLWTAYTTGITIVLAFWQTYDNAIPIMFGTISELLNCGILPWVNSEYKKICLVTSCTQAGTIIAP
jgi:hypothetical protein